MRRLALTAVAVALAVAGCGGGGGGSPLEQALGFMPRDAPFVAAVDTDLGGSQYDNLDRLLGRFPFGDQVKEGIKRSIEQGGADFEKDLRPLLGNPAVVGVPSTRSLGDGQQVVLALKVKDEGKLEDLIEKEGSKKQGEKDGFTIYRDRGGDNHLALKDDLFVTSGSRSLLEDAIERHEGESGLEEGSFEDALSGLPDDAVVRASGDLRKLVGSSAGARRAERIKWVGALSRLGLTASAERDRIVVDFRVQTDGGGLGEADLPIASGDRAPALVTGAGEISLGLRDPRQVLEFAQSAGKAVNPADFEQFERGKSQIERRLGVDIDRDLVEQLTGDLSLDLSVDGKFGLRAELEDPPGFERTLKKVAGALPAVARSLGTGQLGLARPKRGKGFYALADRRGESVVFGVVHGALVVANDTERAGLLTAGKPRRVPGAEGALVLSADAEKLADAALRRLAPGLGLGGLLGGRLFTASLGDLTGYVSAKTDGLRGKLELEID
jgi:hypothetical protein